tara:strand:- start:1844 stop:2119 length:276 start_codon:yes stop_codon:yes gene_type:complete
LWPRGISKDVANLDGWWKELAPSHTLRKWFDHDPVKWEAFSAQYRDELEDSKAIAKEYLDAISGEDLVLLYGAKDKNHTHALILQTYLNGL